jgi:hypothetical protein
MVLYIPTTWFEDLGRAKRVSTYDIDYWLAPNMSDSKRTFYSINCIIEVDDKKAHESFSMFGSSGVSNYQLKSKIRKMIRDKYPNLQAEVAKA